MNIFLLVADAAPQPAAQNSSGRLLSLGVMLVILFGLMYLMIIRPQKKKEQERLQMIQNVKKDDYVLTTGGVYGTVVLIKDNEVTLRIDDSNGTKIRISKNAIIGVEKQGAAKEEGTSK